MGIIIIIGTLVAMVVILLLMTVILPERGNQKSEEQDFEMSEGEDAEE